MAESSPDAINTTTYRHYWVTRLDYETSTVNPWVESTQDVERWIYTEKKGA